MIAPSIARCCDVDPTTFVLAAVFLVVAACATHAQFASGVSVVEVYATVTDSRGEPVAGLRREDFSVTEGGVPQPVSVFAGGDFPLSVAIAIDRSFSMAGARLSAARSGASAFLGELRSTDEAAVLAIGSRVEVVSALSLDRAAQVAAVSALDAFGTTGLYDAVGRAIELTQPGKGRRVLVLLSDGTDRYSATPAEAALEHARHADVIVYPIAIAPVPSAFFQSLASMTGGSALQVKDPRRLPETLRRIARELRYQYLLGYVPRGDAEAGTWRTIRVSVAKPGLRVRAREGYLTR